jgi:hypothetical protein
MKENFMKATESLAFPQGYIGAGVFRGCSDIPFLTLFAAFAWLPPLAYPGYPFTHDSGNSIDWPEESWGIHKGFRSSVSAITWGAIPSRRQHHLLPSSRPLTAIRGAMRVVSF